MAALTPDSIPRRRLDARVRNIGGVVTVGRLGRVVELSDSALFVWQHVDGTRTVSALATCLAEAYQTPLDDSIVDDVIELLEQLIDAATVQAG
ncbi:PqqD family protein [Micromonospora aurantiaca]|uniref:PqqD family protein n=1 Tax=Micromonospora aurantiaca (nom. illeg.) TaxID=47850 RepID=UPI0034559525